MGMTQGVLSAMVANVAPEDLRGTAFGFFNLVTGIGLLISSAVAGLMWDLYGPSFTFYVGAGFSLAAAFALIAVRLVKRS
jgi:MFS family permease